MALGMMQTDRHFRVEESPSVSEGMSVATELELRRTSCRFISAACKRLEMPIDVIATAHVFFHRFFALQSFAQHDRFVIATTCVFLASKVEESALKMDNALVECHLTWIGVSHTPLAPGATLSKTSIATNAETNPYFNTRSADFKTLREKVLICERAIVQTIGFELSVKHPHHFILSLVKTLFPSDLGGGVSGGGVKKSSGAGNGGASPAASTGGASPYVGGLMGGASPYGGAGGAASAASLRRNRNTAMKSVLQTATKIVNDQMQSTLCLTVPPRQIAAAAVYLATLIAGVELTDSARLLATAFEADGRALFDVCDALLNAYEEAGSSSREHASATGSQ